MIKRYVITLVFTLSYLFLAGTTKADTSRDAICLGYGFSIGLSQAPDFHIISRDHQDSLMISTRFLSGKITEIGLFGNGSVLAGNLDVSKVDDEIRNGKDVDGFFIINFRTEEVLSGFSRQEAVLKIEEITNGIEEISFKPFDPKSEVISEMPCSRLMKFSSRYPFPFSLIPQ